MSPSLISVRNVQKISETSFYLILSSSADTLWKTLAYCPVYYRGDKSLMIPVLRVSADRLGGKKWHAAKSIITSRYATNSFTHLRVCLLVMVRSERARQQQCTDSPFRLWLLSTLDWQDVWHTCRYLHCTTQLFPRSVWRVSFFVNIYILPLLILFSLNAPLRSSPDVNHIWVVICT